MLIFLALLKKIRLVTFCFLSSWNFIIVFGERGRMPLKKGHGAVLTGGYVSRLKSIGQ